MKRNNVIAAFVVAFSASTFAGPVLADSIFKPPKAKEGHSYPECYCTNRGQRVEMGQLSCLRIGSQEFTARCGMSLNNPAWRDMTPGCTQPMSEAPPDSEFLEPA